MSKIKILCVHGVSHPEVRPNWQDEWTVPIRAGLGAWNREAEPEIEFFTYDEIFARHPIDGAVLSRAVLKLLGSIASTRIGELFGVTRGLEDVPDRLRWTAGMVAQWTEGDALRAELKEYFAEAVRKFQPDVILAQSLGTLIAYDTLSDTATMPLIEGRTLVTFGSQVGHAAVRSTFGGRLRTLNGAKAWYHLFNASDRVFTARIDLHDGAFHQVLTPFVTDRLFNHDLHEYLTHRNALDSVWRAIATDEPPAATLAARSLERAKEATKTPVKRALLVGINQYRGDVPPLEGCVNDVFEMSATLQDAGFDSKDIRVVLNDRATATNIVERLGWLLEGACPGDERVFYYSGHGAQLPVYDANGQPESRLECLVPHDFAWTPESMVTDRQIANLYSQLPYECRFVMILDCCHAGGVWRDGSAKVRGIEPPDDIRHRELRWDGMREMWLPRTLPDINEHTASWEGANRFVGKDSSTRRFGRATEYREKPGAHFDQVRGEKDHAGPYLPTIIEACSESQKASEYRHGVTSYGVFTYSFTRMWRNAGKKGERITYQELVDRAQAAVKAFGYDQTFAILAPPGFADAIVPYMPHDADGEEAPSA